MKKRLIGLLLSVMLVSVCVGCGAEKTTTEPTETVETTATTQESTVEQTEEETTPPTEIAEQTPEVAAEPVEEATTEPETTEPMETVEPGQTEASTPEPVPQYTYTDMSATMYTTQIVNVRNQPSTDGEKIGSLSAEQEVQVISRCNETGWYKFIWTDGSEAYVSDKYLSDSKVEKPVASETPSNGGNSTANSGSAASNWADGYPRNQWIDMGEYVFYIANSQAEANQVYGDYMGSHTKGEDCHIYHPDLEVRYPDRRMYIMAFTTEKGNVPVCIVSTYINEPWYNPKFIWD